MAGETSDQQPTPINQAMLHCIQECTSCHAVCVHTMVIALYADRKKVTPAQVRLLQDAAEICQSTANFILRGSELYGILCDASAHICEACAAACELHMDDENMRACAETCWRCADACREMAEAAPDWRDTAAGL